MGIIELIILLAIVGAITWAVITYVPMPPMFKNIIVIVVLVLVCIFLLNLFGLMPNLNAIKVGR